MIKMTRDLALSASFDAANFQMKRSGRRAWNVDDAKLQITRFNELWPLEYDYPWASREQIKEFKKELGYEQT